MTYKIDHTKYCICNVQGLRMITTKTQLRFNNRVYSDSPSHGEYLLRCGIDTSNRYVAAMGVG